MPTYTFMNPESGETLTKRLKFAEYEAIRSGEQEVKADDGTVLELIFDAGQIGFVLKDGPSGGWATKAMRENKYRRARSEQMAQRERDHVHKNKLVPNYNGQEANSWREVQDHVRGTKGAASARTYDSLVTKEKRQGAAS
jgi:hypothetical protein